jgi:hypothetical protein
VEVGKSVYEDGKERRRKEFLKKTGGWEGRKENGGPEKGRIGRKGGERQLSIFLVRARLEKPSCGISLERGFSVSSGCKQETSMIWSGIGFPLCLCY